GVGSGPTSTAKRSPGGVAVVRRGATGAAALDLGGLPGVATAGVVAADVMTVGVVATDSSAVADCVLTAGGAASGGLGGATSPGGSDDSVGDVGAAVASRPGFASGGASSLLGRISRGWRGVRSEEDTSGLELGVGVVGGVFVGDKEFVFR